MDPSGICVYGNDVIFNVNDDNYDIFTSFYDEISALFNNKITPYDAWDLCDRGIVNIPNGYDWHFEQIENFLSDLDFHIDNYIESKGVIGSLTHDEHTKFRNDILHKAIRFLNIQIMGMKEYLEYNKLKQNKQKTPLRVSIGRSCNCSASSAASW